MRKKRKQISIFVWIVIYFVFLAAMMGICYLVSSHFGYSYMHTLENTGIILIVIGGLSMLGDLNIRSDVRDNLTKLTRKSARGLTEDARLAAGSRVFFVVLALAGAFLIAAPVIFHIR